MKYTDRETFLAKTAAVREARRKYQARYRDADAHIKDNCRSVARSSRVTHGRRSYDRLEV